MADDRFGIGDDGTELGGLFDVKEWGVNIT